MEENHGFNHILLEYLCNLHKYVCEIIVESANRQT